MEVDKLFTFQPWDMTFILFLFNNQCSPRCKTFKIKIRFFSVNQLLLLCRLNKFSNIVTIQRCSCSIFHYGNRFTIPIIYPNFCMPRSEAIRCASLIFHSVKPAR